MTSYIDNTFSIRNGYRQFNDCLILESLPFSVQNAIHNCFSDLLNIYNIWPTKYEKINSDFGRYYLHLRTQGNQHKQFSPFEYVDRDDLEWFEQIDIFEWIFKYLYDHFSAEDIESLNNCIKSLNIELEHLHYGYRVVDGLFTPIISSAELESVNKALSVDSSNVKVHLQQAVNSISPSKKSPDYRNSIKESISAIGSLFRENFGGNTLGESIKIAKRNNPNLFHPRILNAIDNLYAYTNQPDTGIRHEFLNQDFAPHLTEAVYILINASCLINYVKAKLAVKLAT